MCAFFKISHRALYVYCNIQFINYLYYWRSLWVSTINAEVLSLLRHTIIPVPMNHPGRIWFNQSPSSKNKQVMQAQRNRADEIYTYIVSDMGYIVPCHRQLDQYLGHCPLHRDKPETNSISLPTILAS